jgi:hypothetical protein
VKCQNIVKISGERQRKGEESKKNRGPEIAFPVLADKESPGLGWARLEAAHPPSAYPPLMSVIFSSCSHNGIGREGEEAEMMPMMPEKVLMA